MKVPRDMFDPYKLLNEQELPTMSAKTAIKQIQQLADGTQPNMSPGYYTQRLKAIAILADIAAERMRK